MPLKKDKGDCMKPIIFSIREAQALLNTKPGVWPAEPIDASKPYKSQTRRVAVMPKNAPEGSVPFINSYIPQILYPQPGIYVYLRVKQRYEVGDKLWVRETWQKGLTEDEERYYLYKADGEDRSDWKSSNGHSFSWKPSVHMPRNAARLFLEVKEVRVERLQGITDADALCEGVDINYCPVKKIADGSLKFCDTDKPAVFYLASLWDAVNAKRGYSWDTNPWVFVYEFMRVER